MRHCITDTIYRTPPEYNSVEYAREELLGKSDWVGLATTRPARFNHSASDDMQRVGRRRKISSLKRKRKALVARAGREEHDTMRPLRRAPSLRTEDISVRVGSNIHRTQTTPSIFARKGSTQPPGDHTAEWMPVGETLDESRKYAGPQAPDNSVSRFEQDNVDSRNGGASGPTPTIETNLVPLSEAVELRLSSWDMVRDHSSKSRSQTDASSSLLPSDPSFLSHLQGNLSVDSGSVASQLDKTITGISIPHEHSTPTLPPISRRETRVGASELAEGQKSSLPPSRQRDAPQNSSILGRTISSSEKSAQLPRPTFSNIAGPFRTESSPRFTLDAQMELEDTAQLLERHSKEDRELPTDSAQSPREFDAFTRVIRSDTNPRQLTNLPAGHNGPRILRDTLGSSRSRSTHASLSPHMKTHLSTALNTNRGYNNRHGQVTHATNYPAFAASPNAPIDNDAWMKFVFPADSIEVQDSFQFAASHNPPKVVRARHMAPSSTNGLRSVAREDSSYRFGSQHPKVMSDPFESPRSIPIGANTSLFIPSSQHDEPTETDFLSHLSPMEGCLDERLVDVSVYNNAAKTEHSFWTAPGPESYLPRPSPNTSTSAMLKPLVPAKRLAIHPEEAATSGPQRRHVHESAPSPQQLSPWSFNISTQARQGSARSSKEQRPTAARTLHRSPIRSGINKFDAIRTPTRNYWVGGEPAFAPSTSAEKSPASVFIPSDRVSAGASLSHSTGGAAASINSDTHRSSLPPLSDVSHSSCGPLHPSPTIRQRPALFSLRAPPTHMDRNSTMVNIHTLPPPSFPQYHPQFPAQMSL